MKYGKEELNDLERDKKRRETQRESGVVGRGLVRQEINTQSCSLSLDPARYKGYAASVIFS